MWKMTLLCHNVPSVYYPWSFPHSLMHVSYTWHSPPSAADVVTCPRLVTAASCHRSRSCLSRHRRKLRPQRCRVWGLCHSHKHRRDQYMTVTCDQWHPEEPVTSDRAQVVSRTIITRLVVLFILNEWMRDVLVLTDQNWSWGLVSWVMRIVMFWLYGHFNGITHLLSI